MIKGVVGSADGENESQIIPNQSQKSQTYARKKVCIKTKQPMSIVGEKIFCLFGSHIQKNIFFSIFDYSVILMIILPNNSLILY